METTGAAAWLGQLLAGRVSGHADAPVMLLVGLVMAVVVVHLAIVNLAARVALLPINATVAARAGLSPAVAGLATPHCRRCGDLLSGPDRRQSHGVRDRMLRSRQCDEAGSGHAGGKRHGRRARAALLDVAWLSPYGAMIMAVPSACPHSRKASQCGGPAGWAGSGGAGVCSISASRPGRVEALLASVGDSVRAHRIRGTLVALRREQAAQVLIEPERARAEHGAAAQT